MEYTIEFMRAQGMVIPNWAIRKNPPPPKPNETMREAYRRLTVKPNL